MSRISALMIAAMLCACGGESVPTLVADMGELPDLVALDTTAGLEVAPETAELLLDLGGELVPELVLDTGPVPGEPGYPCEEDEECDSGFCIITTDGKLCTMQCLDECPFGWGCVLHQASLPDELYICAPAFTNLCRPCDSNSDCMTNGVDVGDACVPYGGSGNFCGGACETDGDGCPAGYECQQVEDVSGQTISQCVLLEGECECVEWYISDQAATECFVENEWGLCEGERECAAQGLTPCSAVVPAPETCNLLDDDCDGVVDEDTGGGPCNVVNEFGVCLGDEECVEGVLECAGEAPAPEACDGLDNNCNGDTDEGFDDTDKDGLADCMENDKDGDEVVDAKDNCEFVFNPSQEDFDLDGTGDLCDVDDDNDFAADEEDCKPFDPEVYPDAEELCDGKDNDCDLIVDEGFNDNDFDGDKDCVDVDDDNDGTVDEVDCAPTDPSIYPGADEECDGQDNDCDNLTDEEFPDNDGDGVADCLDTDGDGDGVDNEADNCPEVPNAEQEDQDGDGLGDACEDDADGDGVADCADNCVGVDNPGQEDLDEDGQGNACDEDDDGDGVADGADNCPMTDNPGQLDSDLDGKGDACEDDLDGDSVPDSADNCVGVKNPGQEDLDGDGLGDACDEDADDDGIDDGADNCVGVKNAEQEDQDGDGIGDACDVDADGDGIPDGVDNCEGLQNPGQSDLDLDGVGDECDDDADGDEVDDSADNCVGVKNPQQGDFDGDGEGDKCDEDDDGDGDPDVTDCSPVDPDFHHGAEEVCDGLDNNCALGADEGFLDTDLDGFKNCVDADDDNDGDPDESDCAPLDPGVHAGAGEQCNGADDDCNGQVDDGLGSTLCGQGECQHTLDNCADGVWQVCNPFGGAQAEVCDGLDNDCDGVPDDGLGFVFCGLGQCQHSGPACVDGEAADCDPMEGVEPESCDGLDNDCDGVADDGLGTTTCGLGICEHTVDNCVGGIPQLCDPMEGSELEECDGEDNNCEGAVDEGFDDSDLDGVADCVDDDDDGDGDPDDTDCKPLDESIFNGQDESCDGVDNNCDDVPDEGFPDQDEDGQADCVDDDDDGDGTADDDDNCPDVANPNQEDLDEDGMGDACDPQTCGNGVLEPDEHCDDGGNVDGDGCTAECGWGIFESCLAARLSGLNPPSGSYSVQPQGAGEAETVWCDMEASGGGWTRCATVEYLADQSTKVLGRDGAQIAGSEAGSYFGVGGTAAIRSSCFDLYGSETALMFRHDDFSTNTPGSDFDFSYAWSFGPRNLDGATPYAFVTEKVSCDEVTNISSVVVDDPDPEYQEFTLFFGDGENNRKCYTDGVYNGTSSGIWLVECGQLAMSQEATWLEIADTTFDRMGVRLCGDYSTKQDGVLELYVRAAPPAAAQGQDCKDILGTFPGVGSGAFRIDPEGDGSPFDAWCDMTTKDGGWTLLGSFANDDGEIHWTRPVGDANWRNDATFGELKDYRTDDYKSPAWSTLEADDILVSDETHHWVSYTDVLGGETFQDTMLGYNDCQTTALVSVGSPKVDASNDPYKDGGMLVFYSADPNANDHCAFSGVHSDSTMLAIGGMACGTIGAGQWGTNYNSGMDWHAYLDPDGACIACDGCGPWHGEACVTSKDHANSPGVHDNGRIGYLFAR